MYVPPLPNTNSKGEMILPPEVTDQLKGMNHTDQVITIAIRMIVEMWERDKDLGMIIGFLIHADENKAVVARPMRVDGEGDTFEFGEHLREVANRIPLSAVVIMSEAWVVPQEFAGDTPKVRPSQHPNREEALMATVEKYDGFGRIVNSLTQWHISRNEKGEATLGEPKTLTSLSNDKNTRSRGNLANILPSMRPDPPANDSIPELPFDHWPTVEEMQAFADKQRSEKGQCSA